MNWIVGGAAIVATLGLCHPAIAETIPGPIPARILRVIDGDTLLVEIRFWFGQTVVEHVRIAGIDAPIMVTAPLHGSDHLTRLRDRLIAVLVELQVGGAEDVEIGNGHGQMRPSPCRSAVDCNRSRCVAQLWPENASGAWLQ